MCIRDSYRGKSYHIQNKWRCKFREYQSRNRETQALMQPRWIDRWNLNFVNGKPDPVFWGKDRSGWEATLRFWGARTVASDARNDYSMTLIALSLKKVSRTKQVTVQIWWNLLSNPWDIRQFRLNLVAKTAIIRKHYRTMCRWKVRPKKRPVTKGIMTGR